MHFFSFPKWNYSVCTRGFKHGCGKHLTRDLMALFSTVLCYSLRTLLNSASDVTACVLCTWTASYFKSLLCDLRDKFHRETCHLTKPSALCLISRGIPQLPICTANKFCICIVSVDPHSAAGKHIIFAKQDGEDLRRSCLVLLFQWGSTLTRRGQRRQAAFLSVLECHVHQKGTAPVPPRV